MGTPHEIEETEGMDLRGAYAGPMAGWQFFDNAILTLPAMQEWPGVPDELHLIVMVHPEEANGRGLFRDCRWDYDHLHFVDRVTGDVYVEKHVAGWTVGVFP